MTIVRLPEKRKYHNLPTEIDGYRFASQREAARYLELKILAKAGKITHLFADKKLLRFPIAIDGTVVCVYEADFRYFDGEGKLVIEDCKGFKTPIYRLKKKLLKVVNGLEIREV